MADSTSGAENESNPATTDGTSGTSGGMTFEEAMESLQAAVRRLEEGDLTLDESLASYEEGIQRLSQCQKLLAGAERKIELLSGFDADGNAVTTAFDDKSLTIQEKATARSRRRTAGGGKNGNKSVSGGDEQASTGGPTAEGDDVDLDGTLF